VRHETRQDAAGGIVRLLNETKDYPAETITAGSEVDTTLRALADHYAEIGQPGPALEIYQELFRKIMASNPDLQNDLLNSVYVSRLHTSLAMLLRRTGRGDHGCTVGDRAAWSSGCTGIASCRTIPSCTASSKRRVSRKIPQKFFC
jgi:hypothetical protein